MVVLVTGAHGQLGQSLQYVAQKHPEIRFEFYGSQDLDITQKSDVEKVFNQIRPDYCINAAAYTAVDKAESDVEKARQINVNGPQNLAEVCKSHQVVLLHVSTDFVFDGTQVNPYTEQDLPNPSGVYGLTKLEGEKAIQEVLDKHYIIRTSWVYSQFGHNFMKTMLRLASERDTLSVVADQIGTPTNALDLAETLVQIIKKDNEKSTDTTYGIYNFSNEGQCSWFEFAQKIFEINSIKIELKPIPTTAYPTPAQRPAYSVLDKTKIKNVFNLSIKHWADSLKEVNALV